MLAATTIYLVSRRPDALANCCQNKVQVHTGMRGKVRVPSEGIRVRRQMRMQWRVSNMCGESVLFRIFVNFPPTFSAHLATKAAQVELLEAADIGTEAHNVLHGDNNDENDDSDDENEDSDDDCDNEEEEGDDENEGSGKGDDDDDDE